MTTITKLEAARRLCDAAVVALLDQREPLSAIVLGGSAEDVLAGLIAMQVPAWPTAREQMVRAMRQLVNLESPPRALSDKDGHGLLRTVFNWLRHSDRPGDPPTCEADFDAEAVEVVDRALTNLFLLTGTDHPRYSEVCQL